MVPFLEEGVHTWIRLTSCSLCSLSSSLLTSSLRHSCHRPRITVPAMRKVRPVSTWFLLSWKCFISSSKWRARAEKSNAHLTRLIVYFRPPPLVNRLLYRLTFHLGKRKFSQLPLSWLNKHHLRTSFDMSCYFKVTWHVFASSKFHRKNGRKEGLFRSHLRNVG